MNKIYIILVFLFGNLIIAQTVGIGTSSPNVNAALDITSTSNGALLPRLALITIDNPSPLATDVEGIIAYNTITSATVTATSVTEGMYYNDGVNWNFMGPNTLALGDMKHSLEPADHDGWYLLNGRTKASLPAIAQANATAMGIGANLPDATDKFLKAKTGAEVIGSSAGSNAITLVQANLPNVTFTGTTSLSGLHSHTYTDTYNGTKTLGLATNILALVPLVAMVVAADEILPGNLFPTASNGTHNHTVTIPTGGSNTPITAVPLHIVANVFIYLGQ